MQLLHMHDCHVEVRPTQPLAVDYEGQWGWAELPQQLLSGAQDEAQPPLAFAEALLESRAYHSPHCATALAEHCGLQQLHDGAGSVCIKGLGNELRAEQLRSSVKARINIAWSAEAVKQGVQHAKAGGL